MEDMEDVPPKNPMIYLPYFMTGPLVIKHGTGMFPKNWQLKWDNHRTKWGNSPANHGTDAQWIHPIIHPHHSKCGSLSNKCGYKKFFAK